MPLREPKALTPEYKGRYRVGHAIIRAYGLAGQRPSILFLDICENRKYLVNTKTYLVYTHHGIYLLLRANARKRYTA